MVIWSCILLKCQATGVLSSHVQTYTEVCRLVEGGLEFRVSDLKLCIIEFLYTLRLPFLEGTHFSEF